MADQTELKVVFTGVDQLSPAVLRACETLERINTSIDKLGETSEKTGAHTEKLHTGLINFGAGMEILETAAEGVKMVFEAVEATVEKMIEASLEGERANNLLTGSLVSTGQYSEHVTESIDKYTESVRVSTGANNEMVKSHIAVGIQMGLSVSKSKEMEEASRKLAVLTGGDVNAAFSMLQGTLAGHARGLQKLLPEVGQFGSAQLKQGAAIELVNQALAAQYQMYQGSFAAGIGKAKSSLEEVYKAFGDMITQSDLVKDGMAMFVDVMNNVAESVREAGKWINEHRDSIISFSKTIGEAVLIVGGLWAAITIGSAVIEAASVAWAVINGVLALYSAGVSIATIGTIALEAAIAVLASPITLVVGGVIALTAALYKWPGLFDIIVGSIKTLVGIAIFPLTASLGALGLGVGAIVGIFNKDWGNAITSASTKVLQMNASLVTGGVEQVKYGATHLSTADQAEQGAKRTTASIQSVLDKQSELNRVRLATVQTYGDYEIGTLKEREQLASQAQDRTKAYNDFKKYYDDRIALAVSKESEQAEKVASSKADLLANLAGKGSSVAVDAQSQATILAEQNKRTELKKAYEEERIDKSELDKALVASSQAQAQAELQIQQSSNQQLMLSLGISDGARQLEINKKQQERALEIQNMLQQSQLAGATQIQIDAIRVEQNKATQEQIATINEDYLNKEVTRQTKLGNTWAATLAKIRLEQQKHGALLGAIQAIQASAEYKATNTMLTNVGSLRSSHSQTAFEIGKKAAVAQATIQTFMAATEAYASLAMIPFIGPVLGAAAAAAAVAAGFVQIQNIESQQFSAAHGGIDEVPQDMNNKTFLLKGGERVIQPEANKDLTSFLGGQGQGKSGGGTTINATVNISAPGMDDKGMRQAAEQFVKEIRRLSERGEQIISSKGVY